MIDTKRLFLGVYVDSKLFENKYDKIIRDFDSSSFGNWVKPENLHFTVKFLGDVRSDMIDEIVANTEQFLDVQESTVTFNGLGALPDRGMPRVLYAPFANPDDSIIEIHQKIDDILGAMGFEKETKKFLPHVTLLRVKSATNAFRSVLSKYRTFEFGEMKTYKISLIESRLTPKGPIYNVIR